MQRKALLILAVAAVLLFSSVSRVHAGEAETAYIRVLYRTLGISYNAQADACEYDGVSCPDGPTGSYKIDLANRGLNADQLPNIDGDGTSLRIVEINLSGNRGIRGALPGSWGRLSQLQKLNVRGCSFTRQIPNSWNAVMRSIEEMDLSDNALCTSVPDWAAENFPSLRRVDFSRNQLYFFSDTFGTFSRSTVLESVNLEHNSFCNCAPSTWTSQVLRDAAISGRGDAVGSGCRSTCRGRPECRTNGALSTAGASVMAALVALLGVVFVAL